MSSPSRIPPTAALRAEPKLPVVAAIAACWIVRRAATPAAVWPGPVVFRLGVASILLFAAEGLAIGVAALLTAALLRSALESGKARGIDRMAAAFFRLLRSPRAPLLAGIASAAAAFWVWGLHPAPVVHDEAAYLLQAKLFATGRWKSPASPLPEFFEQMYVFRTPFTAAKYFPGFPAALAPGIWLGLPVVVPVALAGIAGGLIFALARSLAGEIVAALSWCLWTSTPHRIWTMTPYMSQHLTTVLILAAWWGAERWRRTRRDGDLLVAGAALGYAAITRPLTALVAAIPIGVLVAAAAIRERRGRTLAAAFGAGAVFLAVIPLWSGKTTGDWRTTPLALYVRRYTPYDGFGFGAKGPPERALPADLAEVARNLGKGRGDHTLERVPEIAFSRLRYLRGDAVPGWRSLLLPFVLIGGLFAGWAGAVAVATGILNFVAHLPLAHPLYVTVYYVESYAGVAFLAAVGVKVLVLGRKPASPPGAVRRGGLGLLLCAAFFVGGAIDLAGARSRFAALDEPKARFLRTIAAIPGPSIVFVRYGSRPAFGNFVENGPDLPAQKTWVARDLGPGADGRLTALAPERAAYLYDAGDRTLERLP